MQRRNRVLQTIAEVSEMLMAELPEPEMMSRVCQELIRDDLLHMAWIGLLDDDGVKVRPVAARGFISTITSPRQISGATILRKDRDRPAPPFAWASR